MLRHASFPRRNEYWNDHSKEFMGQADPAHKEIAAGLKVSIYIMYGAD
jgi:hypothetical protein